MGHFFPVMGAKPNTHDDVLVFLMLLLYWKRFMRALKPFHKRLLLVVDCPLSGGHCLHLFHILQKVIN